MPSIILHVEFLTSPVTLIWELFPSIFLSVEGNIYPLKMFLFLEPRLDSLGISLSRIYLMSHLSILAILLHQILLSYKNPSIKHLFLFLIKPMLFSIYGELQIGVYKKILQLGLQESTLSHGQKIINI